MLKAIKDDVAAYEASIDARLRSRSTLARLERRRRNFWIALGLVVFLVNFGLHLLHILGRVNSI